MAEGKKTKQKTDEFAEWYNKTKTKSDKAEIQYIHILCVCVWESARGIGNTTISKRATTTDIWMATKEAADDGDDADNDDDDDRREWTKNNTHVNFVKI